ncbi:hypothetical protein B0A52_08784 [Exophiala mesophila]|uniref:Methyltransferase type 11 domain-containing protein n=1 Tax=Exophiala mesophila TaxID=212818 RepID=A0A438MUL1_EXOME|nr:hypothetical protein B0A52_08784 [Exophiala mesophila]
MAESKISDAAQAGFASAAAYEAHRPSYPPEAVAELLDRLEISGVHGARVADLAAGTGKFTEILANRPEQYNVVAIEPHDGMRAQLESKSLPRVAVVKGAAEDLADLSSGDFAAVVTAQAFHWFANMKALNEIARILQPTGVFGMIWNIDDYNAPLSWDIQPGWSHEMRRVVHTFHDDTLRFRDGQWRKVFDEQNRSDPLSLQFSANPIFGLPIGEGHVAYEHRLSPDAVWARLSTLSQIAVLRGEAFDKVKQTFYEAANVDEQDDQGRIAVRGRTVFFWTSKIPELPLKIDG